MSFIKKIRSIGNANRGVCYDPSSFDFIKILGSQHPPVEAYSTLLNARHPLWAACSGACKALSRPASKLVCGLTHLYENFKIEHCGFPLKIFRTLW